MTYRSRQDAKMACTYRATGAVASPATGTSNGERMGRAGWRGFRRGARIVVLIQAATVLVLVLAAGALALASPASGSREARMTSNRSTIGRTWPIAEPDALAEIEAGAARLPRDMSAAFGPRAKWSGLKAAPLSPAAHDRVRSVIPFHTLEFDISLPNGKVLYPKGFTFNPLTYLRMPQRLFIVHPRDLGWALKTARASDFILLTALGAQNGDAITLSERTGRAIYILEERVKTRLGLTVAPVVVTQVGAKLILTEYGPRSRSPQGRGEPR